MMREKIEAALNRIRPALQADGGDVELVDVRDGVVSVRLTGGRVLACGTCLDLRHQGAGVCPISTMSELVEMISESDKVVSLG